MNTLASDYNEIRRVTANHNQTLVQPLLDRPKTA
jgi:hypothetical protein